MIVFINDKVIQQHKKQRVYHLTLNKVYKPLNLAIEWEKSGILIENDIGQLRYYHQSRFTNLSEIRQQKLMELGC
jgi:hypothetical protein